MGFNADGISLFQNILCSVHFNVQFSLKHHSNFLIWMHTFSHLLRFTRLHSSNLIFTIIIPKINKTNGHMVLRILSDHSFFFANYNPLICIFCNNIPQRNIQCRTDGGKISQRRAGLITFDITQISHRQIRIFCKFCNGK